MACSILLFSGFSCPNTFCEPFRPRARHIADDLRQRSDHYPKNLFAPRCAERRQNNETHYLCRDHVRERFDIDG